MRRGLFVILLGASACAPRHVWSGRDLERRVRADVFSNGRTQWLVSKDLQGPRFDAIGRRGVIFSRDGSQLAYAAKQGTRWFMIFGAQTLGPFDAISEPQLSADGKRLVFIAEQDHHASVVVDDHLTRPFEYVQDGTLQLSEDGAHVAFVGSDDRCARIVVDGVEGPCRERVLSLHLDTSGRVSAVVREAGQQRFVFEPPAALPEPPVDEVGEWRISGDHFAYAARHGARWTMVVDGSASPECARVRHVRFGDSGRRAAWVCSDAGLAFVAIDGLAGKPFASVSAPVLARRSAGFAYVANDPQGAWVVSDAETWGPFSSVTDLSVADEGTVAFVARAQGQTSVMVRGRRITSAPVVEGSLVLSDDGQHWGAITGEPATQTLRLTIDGVGMRAVSAEDAFGSAPLHPWLARELREATAGDKVGAR